MIVILTECARYVTEFVLGYADVVCVIAPLSLLTCVNSLLFPVMMPRSDPARPRVRFA